MANRVPLILNTSLNQIQELPTGDNLDLSNSGINNAGIITATTFSGDGSQLTGVTAGNANGLTGTPDITVGNIFAQNVSIASTLTYEDVTNIDSVGIVTARSGVRINGGGLTIIGDTTGLKASGISTFGGSVSIEDKIVHTGDTDTLIRFPSADTFSVETAGTEKFRVTSTGEVGINRNNPVAPITARRTDAGGTGTSGVIAEFANNGGYGVWFGQSSASGASWGATTGDFYWNTGGLSSQVERFRITSAGNVGINSTSPNEVLDVVGNIDIKGGSNSLRITSTAPAVKFTDSDASGGFGMVGVNNTSGSLVLRSDDGNALSNTFMGFEVDGSERLRITSTGGVIFKGGPLQEKVKITAGKLSSFPNIDLADGNVHYFTTQESTTSTPNLRVNSSISLDGVMAIGETVAVTLITTAAAGGYSAALQIHGNAQTVNWVGGSTPSSGGSSGVDIYNYTIIKTGSSAFTVIGNLTKTS